MTQTKKGLLTADALRSGQTELVVKQLNESNRKAQGDFNYSYNKETKNFVVTGHIITTFGDERNTGYDVNLEDKSIRILREKLNMAFYSGNGRMVKHEVYPAVSAPVTQEA